MEEGLGSSIEVESDVAVESAASIPDESFDGFEPRDVDDAETENGLWRGLFRIGFWTIFGRESETITCRSGYLWMTRSRLFSF